MLLHRKYADSQAPSNLDSLRSCIRHWLCCYVICGVIKAANSWAYFLASFSLRCFNESILMHVTPCWPNGTV